MQTINGCALPDAALGALGRQGSTLTRVDSHIPAVAVYPKLMGTNALSIILQPSDRYLSR
jgi:hypothetical protein